MIQIWADRVDSLLASVLKFLSDFQLCVLRIPCCHCHQRVAIPVGRLPFSAVWARHGRDLGVLEFAHKVVAIVVVDSSVCKAHRNRLS